MHSSWPGSLGSAGSSCMLSTAAHQTDWAYASRASTEAWLIRLVMVTNVGTGGLSREGLPTA
ncbi:hypothetical protein [uncultured Friedmanniella sp.]|uniref:hypothetical protein n=1 Tax=uncultured Friedmanniella sp. TaxID=335381 RepID=UPI0035C9EAA6